MIRPLLLAMTSCVLAWVDPAAAFAQSRLVSPPLDGYVVAYEATAGKQSIREEIPEGETLLNWTSMVTTQRFEGTNQSALQLVQAMRESIVRSCSDVSMSEPAELEHQGFEAASYSATCRRPASQGGPETFYLMAVRTSDALLVKQVAFRSDATRENVSWAVTVLRSAIVCDDTCPATSD